MRILFTGASSFTGFWFVKTLAEAGHQITAIFQKRPEEYTGIRKTRINQLSSLSTPCYECSFGSKKFQDLIQQHSWDLFCHHAADVTDYKSPQFNILKALDSNTKNIELTLKQLKENGCQKVLLTGSVFEQNEGKGTQPLEAFSPYGLSKGLTSELFRFYCSQLSLTFGKFVIPNPFGPYEEPRFTTYLIKNWFDGKNAVVNTPDYVRDNIPVTLLAESYRRFAETFSHLDKLNPSGYRESQGAFTQRFSKEMAMRLKIGCAFTLAKQELFTEPLERVNTENQLLNWNETPFWDQLATYYQAAYGK